MRQELITPSLVKRISNRANLTLMLLVGGMFCLIRVTAGPMDRALADLALPFIMLFAHLSLAPLPWQWTGDDRPMAALARGFIQALLFNVAWVVLLLAVLHLTGPGGGPHGPGGPPPFGSMGPMGPHPPMDLAHRPGRLWPPFLGLALVNVAFAIVFGWVFADKEASEARALSMAGLLRQSQARALQNQLEPHVLYNALNSLAELVHDDPPQAEEMVAKLADLYRMLTLHGEAEKVLLLRERLLVEAYLSMEQMRLGERLAVAWDWPDWADTLVLPPLLLQPLVENAVKHGISPSAAGGELRIGVQRAGEEHWLTVANTGKPLAAGKGGVGLANLRARLDLWTESGAGFTLEQDEAWTVATLRWMARTS